MTKPVIGDNSDWITNFGGVIGTVDSNGVIYRNGSFGLLTLHQEACRGGAGIDCDF
jgi:hypothetical protein